MASRKVRLTGFTRFLAFMLFAAPAAYMGAHYYNGEDGLQKFKELIGIEQSKAAQETEEIKQIKIDSPEAVEEKTESKAEPSAIEESNTETQVNGTIARLQDDVKEKDARIQKLYEENESLKQQLEQQAEEFKETKAQLEKIKSAIGQ